MKRTTTIRTDYEVRVEKEQLIAALQEAGLLPAPLPNNVKLTVDAPYNCPAEVRAMCPLEVTWTEEHTEIEEPKR